MAENPVFNFDYDPSVTDFTVSNLAYLTARPDAPFGFIATSAFVIDTGTTSKPRILLVQRAAKDSNPNTWEPPGGACDDEDQTILHAAARELLEETGLQASHIGGLVGEPYLFTTRGGKTVCRFNFAIRLSNAQGDLPVVTLDPNEHQHFVWATEDEVKTKKADGIDLVFTRDEVECAVLLAFEYFKGK